MNTKILAFCGKILYNIRKDCERSVKIITAESSAPKTKRIYKDSFFRHLFTEDTSRLRELYEAVSGRKLAGEIELPPQDSAFFSSVKNDIIFTSGNRLVSMLEHQSTWNENLPLRFLLYISAFYQGRIDPKLLYREVAVPLPTPEFYGFYNGQKEQPEKKTLSLSGAFAGGEGHMDLRVTVYNINYDKNFKIFQSCEAIAAYSQFVAKVRELQEKGLALANAIEATIEWCIEADLLRDYMEQYGKKVMQMITFEYDEKLAMEAARNDGYDAGRAEGESKLSRLISILLKAGKTDDIAAATENADTRMKLYAKYGIA